jgi:hypothetical protein
LVKINVLKTKKNNFIFKRIKKRKETIFFSKRIKNNATESSTYDKTEPAMKGSPEQNT